MNFFCQVSNLLGIFPVLFCWTNHLRFEAAVLALAVLLSTFYHLNEENVLGLLADAIGCSVLISVLIYNFKRNGIVVTPALLLTLLFGSTAIACFLFAGENTSSKTYDFYHSLWHCFSFYAIAFYTYELARRREHENGPSRLCRPIVIRVIDIRALLGRIRRKAEKKRSGRPAATSAVELACQERVA